MKSVAFHNLGCKVNSYELDVMQQTLSENGFEIVPFSQKADIYIINTCTVTNMADRKSRQMLHRAKQTNPDAIVVAVGCYVQTDQAGAIGDDSIDLCIGNNRKKDLLPILMEYIAQKEAEKPESEKKTLDGTTILNMDRTYEYEEMSLKKTAEHTRAYIKIQDGCNQFCSYCAIPLARGRVRSRRWEDVKKEIETMVAAGYKEIVLTGIHISSYGIDFDKEAWEKGISKEALKSEERRDYSGDSKLIDLVERIHDVEGLERIRLGSLEPRIVTAENAERLASLQKVCPHFHLSLQSGCDETLKRMNRHYSAAEYAEGVAQLRRVYDKPAITTDVIVGFPGETEEEFQMTEAFLEQIQFYEMHIFKYSKRANTRAAVMPNQIPEQEKTVRSNRLLEMERKQSMEFRKKYIGQPAEVLWEEEKQIDGKKYRLGHTVDYVKIAVACKDAENANEKTVSTEQGQISRVSVKTFLTEEILLGDEADIL